MPTNEILHVEVYTGTVTEIKASKAELIGELQNLIDRIDGMDEEITDEVDMVPLYDMDGTDYITATIQGE